MSLLPTDASLFFKGRPGDVRLGEIVQPLTAHGHQETWDRRTVVIYGCPDDLGVRLNRGRAGAAKGPSGIRSALYKIAPPLNPDFFKNINLIDAGNIQVSEDITKTHENAHAAAAMIASKSATVLTLGGGHDFAAPNFLGWLDGIQSCKSDRNKCVPGLINVDPHLDVRELENNLPHSGTPFRQILDSKKLAGKNFIEFGARDGRNAHVHFEYCKQQQVRLRLFDDLKAKNNIAKSFATDLGQLERSCSDIAVTIDMDSCCELEGVSAAPVLGFTAWELCQMAFFAGKSSKVSFLELAEVAPELDPTGRSSRIAAEIVFYFIKGRILADNRSLTRNSK